MKRLLLASVLAVVCAHSAHAGPITYQFQMNAPNGYPITDLVMYAADADQDAVFLSPVVLSPSGVSSLTQTLDFEPTRALILGITERDQDDWWDIVMFTSVAYAESALGKRYDALFPRDRNLGHNEITPLMQLAHQGDTTALAAITTFLRGADATAASFNPRQKYAIIQFSIVAPPIGFPVPEPSAALLMGIGAAALAALTRLRNRRPTA